MLVEDEVIIAMRFEIFFQRRGYQVIRGITNGKSALETFKKEVPDLIIMDINLKGDMNGIDTARKIKEIADVHVIFLSGYSDQDLRSKAEIAQPLAYFTKPVNMNQILEIIDNAAKSSSL